MKRMLRNSSDNPGQKVYEEVLTYAFKHIGDDYTLEEMLAELQLYERKERELVKKIFLDVSPGNNALISRGQRVDGRTPLYITNSGISAMMHLNEIRDANNNSKAAVYFAAISFLFSVLIGVGAIVVDFLGDSQWKQDQIEVLRQIASSTESSVDTFVSH